MTSKEHQRGNTLNYLNTLVIVLSVYVLISLVVETFFQLPKEIARLLVLLDDSICIVFLIDFFVRLRQAKDKWKFMRWGWIDLISSIPAFPFLRMGRAVRLVRLFRILRAFRSIRHLVNYLFYNRAYGAFTSVSAIAAIMVIFSSIAILQVERDPNSNIKTAEDAIWWAWVTITTVGYGDKYPVTTEGRIVGSILMAAGVAVLGTFTGFVASWFMEVRKSENESNPDRDSKHNQDIR